MFKHLFNGVSLSSLMLRDAENGNGSPDPKVALRAQLAKGNITPAADAVIPDTTEGNDDEGEEEEDEESEEDEEDDEPERVEETDEQKKEREAKEKIEAKAKRKDDRMQARIDAATARAKIAEDELVKFKNANPDTKLTEAEVETKAQALADKKLADKQLEDIQTKFNAACDKIQSEAKKIDKDFDAKIADVATDFGPIPSFMIGVLEEFDNGGEVLAFIANDDEVAEKVYGFKNSPAKMTKALVDISNKLAEAKKPPKKQISKVPDPGTPVKGNRTVSAALTEADTKNMDNYVAKRQRMMLEKRKLQGF